MRNLNCNVLSASNTESQNGIQIDANQLVGASFQAVFGDSTVSGTIFIEASNDICPDYYQASSFTVTNWTPVPSATVSIVAGASEIITINPQTYRWLRVVFTYAAGGSSTINVNMNAQGV